MALFDSLIKPALDSVTALISQFHMSPEEKAQAQQAINDAAQKAQLAAQDYDTQLNSIAGQNIRAEAQNGNFLTAFARPGFMYIVEIVIGFNYIVIPLVQLFQGKTLAPIVLPADLLTLFGVCVTGYVFNRTAEKVAAMPGDSQVSIPGLKVSNKS